MEHCLLRLFKQKDECIQKYANAPSIEEIEILRSLPIIDKNKSRSLFGQLYNQEILRISDVMNVCSTEMVFRKEIVQKLYYQYKNKCLSSEPASIITLYETIGLCLSKKDLIPENVFLVISLLNKIEIPEYGEITAFLFSHTVNIILSTADFNLDIYIEKEILTHYYKDRYLSSKNKLDSFVYREFTRRILSEPDPSDQIYFLYNAIYLNNNNIIYSLSSMDFENFIMFGVLTFKPSAIKLFMRIASQLSRSQAQALAGSIINCIDMNHFQSVDGESVRINNIPVQSQKPNAIERFDASGEPFRMTNFSIDDIKIESILPKDIINLANILIDSLKSASSCIYEYFFAALNEESMKNDNKDQYYILLAFNLVLLNEYPQKVGFFTNLFKKFDVFDENETMFGPFRIRPLISAFRTKIITICNRNANSNFFETLLLEKKEYPFFVADILGRSLMKEIISQYSLSANVLDIVISSQELILFSMHAFPKECKDAINITFSFIRYFINHSPKWPESKMFIDNYINLLINPKYEDIVLDEIEEILSSKVDNSVIEKISQPLNRILNLPNKEDTINKVLKKCRRAVQVNNDAAKVVCELLPLFISYLGKYPSEECLYDILDTFAVIVYVYPTCSINKSIIKILNNAMKVLEPNGVKQETLRKFMIMATGRTFSIDSMDALFICNYDISSLVFLALSFEKNFVEVLKIFNKSIMAIDGNASTLFYAGVSELLLQFLCDRKESTKVVYNGVSFDIFIEEKNRQVAIDLFFNIIKRRPSRDVFEKLINHITTKFDDCSRILLDKLLGASIETFNECRPSFIISNEMICSIKSNHFAKLFSKSFSFSFWINVDKQILLTLNAEIILLRAAGEHGKEFIIRYFNHSIEALFKDADKITKVPLINEPFKIPGWNLFTLTYSKRPDGIYFMNTRNYEPPRLSAFTDISMGIVDEITFCTINPFNSRYRLGFFGAFALFDRELSEEEIKKMNNEPYAIPGNCFFSSSKSYYEKVSIDPIKAAFARRNLKQTTLNNISKESREKLLLSLINTEIPREFADKLLLILELAIKYDGYNPSERVIKQISNNFNKNFIDYRMYKTIQSIANSSNDSKWLSSLVFNPYIWKSFLTRVLKNWCNCQFNFTSGFEIGQLIIDYFVMCEKKMINDEQKQLFKVAIRRMLAVRRSENDICILVLLFKKADDDEIKTSLLSLIPEFSTENSLTTAIIPELIYSIPNESTEVVAEIVFAVLRIDKTIFHQCSINIIQATQNKEELYDLLLPSLQSCPDLFPLLCGLSLYIKPEKLNIFSQDPKPCANRSSLWYLFPTILLMKEEFSSDSGNVISMIYWIVSNFDTNTRKEEIASIMFMILLLSNNERYSIFNEFINALCQVFHMLNRNDASIINTIFTISATSIISSIETNQDNPMNKTKAILDAYANNRGQGGRRFFSSMPMQRKIKIASIDDVTCFSVERFERCQFVFGVAYNDNKRLVLEERLVNTLSMMRCIRDVELNKVGNVLSKFKERKISLNVKDVKENEAKINVMLETTNKAFHESMLRIGEQIDAAVDKHKKAKRESIAKYSQYVEEELSKRNYN